MSNITDSAPKPNLVGSPNTDAQSSVKYLNREINKHVNIFYTMIFTVVVCINNHLQYAKYSSCKVQDYVANTPSNSTFTLVIHNSLEVKNSCMNILNKTYLILFCLYIYKILVV